jgi:hypothetical protein
MISEREEMLWEGYVDRAPGQDRSGKSLGASVVVPLFGNRRNLMSARSSREPQIVRLHLWIDSGRAQANCTAVAGVARDQDFSITLHHGNLGAARRAEI